MKKIFLTFVLAIVSSLWMMSEGASCLTQAPNNLQSSYITVSGTIQWLDNPCEEGEVCPACITPAIVTSDKTYYLSSSNQEVQDFLDRIEMAPVPAIYQLPLQASATGIPYTQGSFDFLVVNNLNSLYVQYFSDQRGSINSLCDEWNVLISNMSMGPMFESFNTIHYRLTTDTIINGTRYVRLERGGGYKGAMREGNNRDIYYIPANSTHEYLIYAFNAQVGATLTNMWVGGSHADTYNGKRAIVREIQDTNPRTFVVGYEFTYNNGNDTEWWDYTWIEGVGMTSGPNGNPCPFDCNGAAGESVLCAYKNGEQVYTSEIGEKYGCEYNYNPSQPMFPSDTKWHYVYTEMYGGPDFKPRYFSVSPIDTVINNTHYQQINGILFRSDATKVWCVIDSMDTRIERLVYDFDLQVGDSIRKLCYGYDGYWTEEPYCEESRYAKVTNVEYIQLGDGRMARRLSYDNRPDDIEHIGCVDGIFAPLNFPVSTCGCGDYFQCCTRGDVLLYEVESGACDTFFIKEQPTDTIPLYARDDSGSSTVDPVDPNQIYATLTGNVLTIHNRTGVQVTFTLNNTSSNNLAARVRKNGQPTTFTESISVELTEDGIYEILLTSEEWNYSIFGTFNHVRSSTSTTKQDPSLTAKKLLRGTQILIERGNKTYTLTGQEVK